MRFTTGCGRLQLFFLITMLGCAFGPGHVALGQNSVDPTMEAPRRKLVTQERIFQFSLFPGISTNGLNSGSFYNKYSINLFGGVSAGNHIVELGGISNVNLQSTTGIQIAGLGNIVGTNAFSNLSVSEQRALTLDGFKSNAKGIQVAGLLNYVRNNVAGIQLTAGFNVVGDDSKGIQLAGFGNTAGGDSEGLQLASLYNISRSSMAGFQVSALLNYTEGQLSGAQIALVNKAGKIKGGKTTPPTGERGLQFGLLNFSKSLDGWQVGLVNFAKTFRGKQIGLINFFPKYGSKEIMRMGTPIGLLNFGSRGSYLRVHYNEMFPINVERTTGNCLNCTWTQSEMPIDDRHKIFNQNALILGLDLSLNTWGFGYGFQKVLYNKSSMLPTDPNNEKWLTTYGVKFMHLNRNRNFDKTFNLLNRINLDFGKRKWSGYMYVGVSLNYFIYADGEAGADVYKIRSVVIPAGHPFNLNADFWPGYSAGFQF